MRASLPSLAALSILPPAIALSCSFVGCGADAAGAKPVPQEAQREFAGSLPRWAHELLGSWDGILGHTEYVKGLNYVELAQRCSASIEVDAFTDPQGRPGSKLSARGDRSAAHGPRARLSRRVDAAIGDLHARVPSLAALRPWPLAAGLSASSTRPPTANARSAATTTSRSWSSTPSRGMCEPSSCKRSLGLAEHVGGLLAARTDAPHGRLRRHRSNSRRTKSMSWRSWRWDRSGIASRVLPGSAGREARRRGFRGQTPLREGPEPRRRTPALLPHAHPQPVADGRQVEQPALRIGHRPLHRERGADQARLRAQRQGQRAAAGRVGGDGRER